MSLKAKENQLNGCLKCIELNESIDRLRDENRFLTDRLLVSEQQSIALNNIRIESFKCLHISETIVKKLETNVGFEPKPDFHIKPESETKPEFKFKQEFEAKPEWDVVPETVDPEVEAIAKDLRTTEESSDESVGHLKHKYYKAFNDLDNWVKQLDQINSIKSFARIHCNRYVDNQPIVRRSERTASPVTPLAITSIAKERDLFRKQSPEEMISLRDESTDSPAQQRLSCPYPKCGFTTRRGAKGLKEHSQQIHKRKITAESVTPSAPDAVTTPDLSAGLRCTYANCAYVTNTGRVRENLQKHIKRIHSKAVGAIKVNSNIIKETNGANKGKLRHCPYSGCTLKTIYPRSLERHIQHMHQTGDSAANGSKWLVSIALMNKMKAQNPKPKPMTNSNESNESKSNKSAKNRPILRCSKCSYKTPYGLSKLKKHMKIHNNDMLFKCDKCDAGFSRNVNLKQHKQLIHKIKVNLNPETNKWKNECHLCRRNFRWPSDLKRHVLSHKKSRNKNQRTSALTKTYECPHENCLFTSNRVGLLQKHVITHIVNRESEEQNDYQNNGYNESQANGGDSQLEFIKTENASESESHPMEDSVDSPVGSDFKFMSNIIQNTTKVNEKNQKRNLRPKSSQRLDIKSPLNVEMDSQTPLSTRLMQSLFKCDANDCSFSSTDSEDWIKHNDWHESQDKHSLSAENKRRFKCIRCSKSYTKHSLLKAHQRLKRHTSFDCGNCNEMFRSAALLRVHILSKHSNEPTAPALPSIPSAPVIAQNENICDFPDCNKSFVLLKNKLIHMERVHNMAQVSAGATDGNAMLGSELCRLLASPPKVSNESTVRIDCPFIECKTRFGLRAVMLSHFNKSHKHITDERLIRLSDEMCRCSQCGQLFNNAGNMKRHKSQAHRTSPLRRADEMIINPQLFNSSVVDNSYDESTGYMCQRSGCGKWFESALDLRQHLNIEHNRNTDALNDGELEAEPVFVQPLAHRCDICNLDLSNANELEQHFKNVHFMSEEPEVIEINDITNEDTYGNGNIWLVPEEDMPSELPFDMINDRNEENRNELIVDSVKPEIF